MKYFSLELLFSEKEKTKKRTSKKKKKKLVSALKIVFLKDPRRGLGLIQREEEEHMRYERKKKELKQCCLISLFSCCLSLSTVRKSAIRVRLSYALICGRGGGI